MVLYFATRAFLETHTYNIDRIFRLIFIASDHSTSVSCAVTSAAVNRIHSAAVCAFDSLSTRHWACNCACAERNSSNSQCNAVSCCCCRCCSWREYSSCSCCCICCCNLAVNAASSDAHCARAALRPMKDGADKK